MNTFKQFLMALLGRRQRERLRHYLLARQVARGEPIREKEVELIRQLVAAGDRVGDIGANVGLFTRELAKLVGPKGHVYAFEPVLSNFKILTAVIRNAELRNVSPYHVALGERSGERTMIIPDAAGFVGYYQAHFDEDGGEAGQRELVETATMDNLFANGSISRLDFIKCDVEGAELQVLKGAVDLIRASKPAFMIEVSRGTSEECFRFFHDLQYTAWVYDGSTHATETYLDGKFSNYFFLHPESKYAERLSVCAEASFA